MVAWSDKQPTPLSSGELPWTPVANTVTALSLDAGLSTRQQQQITHLLQDFPNLFSTNPGFTTQVQHVIETQPRQVCRTALRLLPWSRWKAVDKEISYMLRLSIIEPCKRLGAVR